VSDTAEKLADVEFRVYFDGNRWVAAPVDEVGNTIVSRAKFGAGSTPITALMRAEAKARKAAR
jgi:hypothetical protein